MQFGRTAKVTVGVPGARGREWTGLRMSLSVQASDAKQPGRLQAKLYNLSDDSVAFLQSEGLVAQLLAGYETPLLIGTGEVTRVSSVWQGADRITTIECSDGRGAYSSRVNMSLSGTKMAKEVIGKVAEKMGFDAPDLSFIDDFEIPGLAAVGKATDAMDGLTKSAGADWHIERGGLVVLPKNKPSSRDAVLLRPDTGLVGTPQRTQRGIKIKCLLNPHIRTRSIVRVESREVEGFYMVRTYTHAADTHADAWHTEIEADRIE